MITHVAIKYNGKLYSLPKPNRHHDIHRLIHEETGDESIRHDEQGFLDEKGQFYRRVAAKFHAQNCNQLLPHAMNLNELYSEDVW